MASLEIEPWEPEETVGKLWHALASGLDAPLVHEAEQVRLDEVGARLAILFRGLGGDPAVELRPAPVLPSPHRLSRRRKLGTAVERLARASFDGVALRLPPELAVLPDRGGNTALYLWLAASAAHAAHAAEAEDPLQRDLAAIAAAVATTRATLEAAPGLARLHRGLSAATLALRRLRSLPRQERAVEATIRTLLGGEDPRDALARDMLAAVETGAIAAFTAERAYRPFEPVPLWLDAGDRPPNETVAEDEAGPGSAAEEGGEVSRRARRRKSDQAERRDSLILHKFEAILSFADFLNLNRRVDDDDADAAKKAADDMDEIALGQVSKTPATRLKLHLDLSPSEAERERLSGADLYPEWDHRAGAYLPDHCRVLSSLAEPIEVPSRRDPAEQRRIRAVRRQFGALRPRRVMLPGQTDGETLDIDAAVRSAAEMRASGRGSDRIWRATRCEERDLAVSILFDASRSTESAVTGRAVIEVAREALTALAWGLTEVGDDCAIHAFSSLRRARVFVQACKGFREPMGTMVEARIAGLRPGHYTRLGAALRHVSAELARQPRQRRLLIVITDGKPNDLDHYEGQHGIEDSRMAIREARRTGQAVFGIAVDARSRAWFPRIFGRGGFAVIPDPDRLTAALPGIYRHLVGA